MNKTDQQYDEIIQSCKSLFLHKAKDYGPSWRILRLPSITDLILIKAERIRSIQEKKVNMVGDSLESDFIGIINYCIIALMQYVLEVKKEKKEIGQLKDLSQFYDQVSQEAKHLMKKKNHDYGEAWRKMRISSITDLILMKVFRLKQIEDQQGEVLVSEGVEANYLDMLNYGVFSLIKMKEEENTKEGEEKSLSANGKESSSSEVKNQGSIKTE